MSKHIYKYLATKNLPVFSPRLTALWGGFVLGVIVLGGAGWIWYDNVIRSPGRVYQLALKLFEDDANQDAIRQFRRAVSFADSDTERARLYHKMAEWLASRDTTVNEAVELGLFSGELRIAAVGLDPATHAEHLPLQDWRRMAVLSQHPAIWRLCWRAAGVRRRAKAIFPGDRLLEVWGEIELALSRNSTPGKGWESIRQRLAEYGGAEKLLAQALGALCKMREAKAIEVSSPGRAAKLCTAAEKNAKKVLQTRPLRPGAVAVALRVLTLPRNPRSCYSEAEYGIWKSFGHTLVSHDLPDSSEDCVRHAFMLACFVRLFAPPPGKLIYRKDSLLPALRIRARKLLTSASNRVPPRVALAEIARLQGDIQTANTHYKWLVDNSLNHVPISLRASMFKLGRLHALPKIAWLALDHAEQKVTHSMPAHMRTVKDYIDRLPMTASGRQSDLESILRARLLFVKGRMIEALGIIMKKHAISASLQGFSDYVAARCFYELEQLGAACDLLGKIHRRGGDVLSRHNFWQAEELYVRTLMKLRRFEKAARVSGAWPAKACVPGSNTGRWLLRLRAQMLAHSKKAETKVLASDIVSHLPNLDPKDRAKALVLACGAWKRCGKPARATQLLRQYSGHLAKDCGGIDWKVLLPYLAAEGMNAEALQLARHLMSELPPGPVSSMLCQKLQDDKHAITPVTARLIATAAGTEQFPLLPSVDYLVKNGQWGQLEKILQRKLSQANCSATIVFRLQEKLNSTGELQALEYLQHNLSNSSTYCESLMPLVEARIALHKGDAAEAVALITPLADRWSFLAPILKVRGDAQRGLEQYNAARKSYRRAVYFMPQYVLAYLGLFRCEHRLGFYESALEHLTVAWQWSHNAKVRDLFLRYMKHIDDRVEVKNIQERFGIELDQQSRETEQSLADHG